MYNPQLTTFLSVAQNGSFTKAADVLYITPTAVMKQINALEERLGIVLFARTNHGLQLTEAGKSFLQDARYVIDYSDRAIEKTREIADKNKQQSIRIGTSIMTPAKFLLDIWTEIQKFNPHLKIELIPFENTPVNSVEILRNLGKHIDIVAGLYDDNFLSERGCKAAPPTTHMRPTLRGKAILRPSPRSRCSLPTSRSGRNAAIIGISTMPKRAAVKS